MACNWDVQTWDMSNPVLSSRSISGLDLFKQTCFKASQIAY